MADRSPSAKRACIQCGASPITGNKFCSAACRSAKYRKGSITNAQRLAMAACRQTHQCLHCSREFQPKRKGRTSYCSRECAFGHRKEHRRPKHRLERKCGCGATLEPNRRLCAACRYSRVTKAYYTKRPKVVRACMGCGATISGTAAKTMCKPCRIRQSRIAYQAKHGRVKKHKERAKRFGVDYEPINPLAVFDRDKWRCQICGCPTPKKLRGTTEPNAPELDHRIPMAAGGPHTWANVQCACRACNASKGATQIKGQMHLFPTVWAGG